MVVTEVRRAVGGTVLVSEKRDTSIELAVPAVNAPLGVTIGSLKLGATFGVGSEAVWKMATETGSLTVWVKMLRLSELGRPGDQYGFDAAPGTGTASAVAFDSDAYLDAARLTTPGVSHRSSAPRRPAAPRRPPARRGR